MVGLVDVHADLSRIPVEPIAQKQGRDGNMYYNIECEVQITFYSAYTTYELIYDGINDGLVTAEYV